MDDLYWCREGCGFVDKDHRCEQWCHIYCIPGEARARIRAEARAEALREARKKIQALSDNLGSGDGMMTDKDRAMEDAFDLVFEILADEQKGERGAERPWHTEPPSKEGLYLVEVNAKFSSPSPWYETAFYRKRDGWSLPEPSKGSEVLAWMEIPRRAEVERGIEEAGR